MTEKRSCKDYFIPQNYQSSCGHLGKPELLSAPHPLYLQYPPSPQERACTPIIWWGCERLWGVTGQGGCSWVSRAAVGQDNPAVLG